MKKTVITLLSVLTLSMAGGAWARSPHGGARLERLTEALQLEPQQVQQVTQVLQEQRDKRETLRDTLHEQMRADMQAVHQETVERLRPILSAEQLQKFLQLSEARRARHHERREFKRPSPAEQQ
ncbi:MAG: hypothetical protein FJZ47_09525 [Candidatus Tectomicrobia bacterium]|uniref:Periplasmic heavy metal sensor n=1 Tax=Tectimicrobiota bacterium TaxID=2528274 RepID=A0A937VZS9_UNCTE|nr:hypothetical protein [Candidatus Tectomicrobia bacterium]